jgi:hypothetical protein
MSQKAVYKKSIKPLLLLRISGFIWGFLVFFPEPAIPISNYFGLQFGQIAGIIILLLFGLSYLSQILTKAWFILIVPPVMAILVAYIFRSDSYDLQIPFKGVIVFAIYLFPIVISGLFLKECKYELLMGVILAVIIHGFVGAIQLYAFPRAIFPFRWLYNNPHFALPENVIYRGEFYRVFGLFPEPSVLAASMAHWVLLFIAIHLNIGNIRVGLTNNQIRLIISGMYSGLFLMIFTGSGHLVFFVIGLLSLLYISSRTSKKLFKLSVFINTKLFQILLVLVILASFLLITERGGRQYSGSWSSRMGSIIIGLNNWINSDLIHVIFGQLDEGIKNVYIPGSFHQGIVWSVMAQSIISYGVIMVLSWLYIIRKCYCSIKRSSLSGVGLVFGGVYFLGLMFTSSYAAEMSQWLTLSWLLYWDRIFKQNKY